MPKDFVNSMAQTGMLGFVTSLIATAFLMGAVWIVLKLRKPLLKAVDDGATQVMNNLFGLQGQDAVRSGGAGAGNNSSSLGDTIRGAAGGVASGAAMSGVSKFLGGDSSNKSEAFGGNQHNTNGPEDIDFDNTENNNPQGGPDSSDAGNFDHSGVAGETEAPRSLMSDADAKRVADQEVNGVDEASEHENAARSSAADGVDDSQRDVQDSDNSAFNSVVGSAEEQKEEGERQNADQASKRVSSTDANGMTGGKLGADGDIDSSSEHDEHDTKRLAGQPDTSILEESSPSDTDSSSLETSASDERRLAGVPEARVDGVDSDGSASDMQVQDSETQRSGLTSAPNVDDSSDTLVSDASDEQRKGIDPALAGIAGAAVGAKVAQGQHHDRDDSNNSESGNGQKSALRAHRDGSENNGVSSHVSEKGKQSTSAQRLDRASAAQGLKPVSENAQSATDKRVPGVSTQQGSNISENAGVTAGQANASRNALRQDGVSGTKRVPTKAPASPEAFASVVSGAGASNVAQNGVSTSNTPSASTIGATSERTSSTESSLRTGVQTPRVTNGGLASVKSSAASVSQKPSARQSVIDGLVAGSTAAAVGSQVNASTAARKSSTAARQHIQSATAMARGQQKVNDGVSSTRRERSEGLTQQKRRKVETEQRRVRENVLRDNARTQNDERVQDQVQKLADRLRSQKEVNVKKESE